MSEQQRYVHQLVMWVVFPPKSEPIYGILENAKRPLFRPQDGEKTIRPFLLEQLLGQRYMDGPLSCVPSFYSPRPSQASSNPASPELQEPRCAPSTVATASPASNGPRAGYLPLFSRPRGWLPLLLRLALTIGRKTGRFIPAHLPLTLVRPALNAPELDAAKPSLPRVCNVGSKPAISQNPKNSLSLSRVSPIPGITSLTASTGPPSSAASQCRPWSAAWG